MGLEDPRSDCRFVVVPEVGGGCGRDDSELDADSHRRLTALPSASLFISHCWDETVQTSGDRVVPLCMECLHPLQSDVPSCCAYCTGVRLWKWTGLIPSSTKHYLSFDLRRYPGFLCGSGAWDAGSVSIHMISSIVGQFALCAMPPLTAIFQLRDNGTNSPG